MLLSVNQISKLTGRDRHGIPKRLETLPFTPGDKGAHLYESREAHQQSRLFGLRDLGGTYSAGTVFCWLAEEFCEFMLVRYARSGLKIAVLAISKLCAAYQTWDSLAG
jgi:hypothetical protein